MQIDSHEGGLDVIKLLSTAFGWLNPNLIARLASECGFDGVELLIGRHEPPKWPQSVKQIHPTHRFRGQRGCLTALERMFLGNVETSAGWESARRHGLPLILHVNTLEHLGQNWVARQIGDGGKILIENIPRLGSLRRVVDAVALCSTSNINASVLFDVEHYLMEIGWRGENLALILRRTEAMLNDTTVGCVHICGLHPDKVHQWIENTDWNHSMLEFVAGLAGRHNCPVSFEPTGNRWDQIGHCFDRDVCEWQVERLAMSAEMIRQHLG